MKIDDILKKIKEEDPKGKSIMLDIKNLFNVRMPEGLLNKKHIEVAHAIDATYQFNITGVGQWKINSKNGTTPTCIEGEDKNAECTITLDEEWFHLLLEGFQANGMHGFFSQKIVVDGNQIHYLKLQRLFECAGHNQYEYEEANKHVRAV